MYLYMNLWILKWVLQQKQNSKPEDSNYCTSIVIVDVVFLWFSYKFKRSLVMFSHIITHRFQKSPTYDCMHCISIS